MSPCRRVAVAVVRGTEPGELFEMIARELGQLLGVRAASVGRDPGGTHTEVLGNWTADDELKRALGIRVSDRVGRDLRPGHGGQRRADRAKHLERTRALVGIGALARAIDAKDPGTRRHSDRVAALATRLAVAAGWAPGPVARLQEAALVLDVGKIGVPDAILLRPGALTAGEYEQMKRHAALGAEMLQGVLTMQQVTWVRGHHERPDGPRLPRRTHRRADRRRRRAPRPGRRV